MEDKNLKYTLEELFHMTNHSKYYYLYATQTGDYPPVNTTAMDGSVTLDKLIKLIHVYTAQSNVDLLKRLEEQIIHSFDTDAWARGMNVQESNIREFITRERELLNKANSPQLEIEKGE